MKLAGTEQYDNHEIDDYFASETTTYTSKEKTEIPGDRGSVSPLNYYRSGILQEAGEVIYGTVRMWGRPSDVSVKAFKW